jgi:hypothetical protein
MRQVELMRELFHVKVAAPVETEDISLRIYLSG